MSEDSHTDQVNKVRTYSVENFDKSVLFIASGSLAISFAFIKDIIPNLKDAKAIESLICSWYVFAIVIFLSLVSHFVSALGSTWAAKQTNLDDQSFNQIIGRWNWSIRILNVLMILGILIGAYFLINFININLLNNE